MGAWAETHSELHFTQGLIFSRKNWLQVVRMEKQSVHGDPTRCCCGRLATKQNPGGLGAMCDQLPPILTEIWGDAGKLLVAFPWHPCAQLVPGVETPTWALALSLPSRPR